MQNAAWEALLRHIPADQQNGYMVVTTSGVEIAVQDFLRIESELLVFRGRLSGSQDQGLLFFMPYARIEYVGTMKAVKDTEVAETFGSLTFPAAPAANAPPAQAPPPVNEGPPAAAEPATNGASTEGSGKGSKPGIRSEVLERFRSRSASSLSLPSPPRQP
jgi:hypothetical protein